MNDQAKRYLPTPRVFAFGKGSVRAPAHRLAIRSNRGCGGLLVGPSSGCDSVVHNGNRDAVPFCDLGPRRVAVSHMNNGPVSSLRFSGSPSAVFWFIANRVVLPFYRKVVSVTRLLRPLEKVVECKPLLADRDALPAVVFVGCVAASTKHVAPTCVNFGALHAVRGGPVTNSCARSFASTRYALASPKVASADGSGRSARAYAAPNGGTSFLVARLFNNFPLAKCAASHINNSWVVHHGTPGVTV